jgi:hypothetical protein
VAGIKDITRVVTFGCLEAAYSPHASGGGAISASYTGTAIGTLNCSALGGHYVELRSEVISTNAEGTVYRFCWLTAAEAADAGKAFASSNVAASLNPAASAKIPSRFGGSIVKTQYVDPVRNVLAYKPVSSVAGGDRIIAAVTSPHPTS